MVVFGNNVRPKMSLIEAPESAPDDLFITGELDRRADIVADYRQEMLAIQDLAARMADSPDEVLPRFVDLAMELAGGVSAGLSLYEPEPAPGVFRWRYLRGTLSPFEGALTPRNFSPCGVTLDENQPVLSKHPERVYDWIAEADIVVPEVLLVPLYLRGLEPLGTLWIVADRVGHFTRGHARAMTELASFVGIALRMLEVERRLEDALGQSETLAHEMGHRVKNLFALTEGMVRLSARNARDTADLAEAISGRLHALASAHALVSRNLRDVGSPVETNEIGAVIRAVVRPHERLADDPSRCRITGPTVRCGEQAVNGVALIFHELATNAVKYGALSTDDGRVVVEWRRDEADLVLTWSEHDGPPIDMAPRSEGFGSTLVRNTVTRQLNGRLIYEWAPEGLKVEMRLPLTALG